jgi:hypothetical protein
MTGRLPVFGAGFPSGLARTVPDAVSWVGCRRLQNGPWQP